MATDTNINITPASLRGSPSDRIIKPRPRKDSLQSISGSDTHPGRVVKPRARKSPGSGAKRSEPAKRKFICSFSHYGCDVALSSKNEWKRHVSIQHLQLGFYRCDVGSCNPDLNPNVPGHKRVYNDFNRKDLFTQHHRRMHKPESGPGSANFPPNAGDPKDWRAFEDSLEDVRNRCWVEKRKPPQRSTCGFCGRVFEGEGSWNERMEHVGGHFSRDIVEAKEEREDEDLTNWAVAEGIIKDAGAGHHVLIDQPPIGGERPYMTRDRDVNMTDAPSSDGLSRDPAQSPSLSASSRKPDSERGDYYPSLDSPREARRLSNALPSTNGTPRAPSVPLLQPAPGGQSAPPTDPALTAMGSPTSTQAQLQSPPTPSERKGYNLAPPPLKASKSGSIPPEGDDGSGDRLEDLINQLIKPKGPKTHRRLIWKCDCAIEMSVDLEEGDLQNIRKLQDISIVCSKTSNPYLKASKTGKYHVIGCDELADYIWKNTNHPVEHHDQPKQVAAT
ncbi:hypothetical protein LTR99_009975 [Exophiala xenobiotica]|uniref:C2H2-type domain-containing protein n=1 Tax=Vermiconidia calcicola TaxID=1690605 RepID=A0AAV9PVD4_9PEZI|nr:hypothetical protein LTR92_004982 [Exophiala xenobiotica]KAK5530406.1 hypothetical protein LTR25_008984 [Vermiconidia calcicola]KAK5531569.1 hypothetical protein LTR23_009922 [Chaetothyriales sp. CCFEE 6169]KAK5204580.1 hypothetical protein LTR41_009752 [Exophiala xenobiotica]KAK5264610.1 hypothetical protein LTR96_010090 [Exophiala xenobiotica]